MTLFLDLWTELVLVLQTLAYAVPYIAAYVDVIERSFQRPIGRFLAGHGLLDAVAATALVALAWKGLL